MPNNADVEFTFDAESFVTSINKLTQSIEKMPKQTSMSVNQMTKAVQKGMTRFSLMAVTIFGAVKGAVKSLLAEIPEIGTTFKIAGQIIRKNLLFPLRKALLPILQKVLSWVQENRAVFTKFGVVLVNAFKMVGQVFKSLMKIVEPFIKQIKRFISSIFGDTVKSLDQLFNILIFKLTTLIIAVQTLIQPLADSIAELFGEALFVIKDFISNLAEGFMSVASGAGIIDDLVDTLDALKEILEMISPLLSFIGKILGGTIAVALKIITNTLKRVVVYIKDIINLFKNPSWENFIDIFRHGAKGTAEIVTSFIGKDAKEKTNQYIDKMFDNPSEVMGDAKSGAGKLLGGIKNNFTGNTFIVTEGNAEQTAKNFVKGAGDGSREQLQNTMILEGDRP